jgi:hypothetical protein
MFDIHNHLLELVHMLGFSHNKPTRLDTGRISLCVTGICYFQKEWIMGD